MNIGSYSNNSDIDISGLTKDNADEARMIAMRILRDDRLSRYPRVEVKGHGEKFRAQEVRMALMAHFSVFGFMDDVVIPTNPQSGRSERSGFIYFFHEGDKQKALTLNGSVMGIPFPSREWLGGWTVVVKDVPNLSCEYSPDQVAAAHAREHSRQSSFLVSGYPSWLPLEVVRSALFRVFRSCGEIIYVNIREDKPGVLHSCGSIRLWGEDGKQKAAQLDGTDMGGWNVVVTTGPTRAARRDRVDTLPTGWDGPPGLRWWEYKPMP